MRLLLLCVLMVVWVLPAAAQDQPLIEVTCMKNHADDYSRFLREAADALDSAIEHGADPDLAIANTEGVLSIVLNLLASCDSLYFSSTAYRAEPGETVAIDSVNLRRGAYRVLATGEGDVSFQLVSDTCGMDEAVTLSADDIKIGMYAIVMVDEPCEAVLHLSGEAEDYGLYLNYIPRQPVIIGD